MTPETGLNSPCQSQDTLQTHTKENKKTLAWQHGAGAVLCCPIPACGQAGWHSQTLFITSLAPMLCPCCELCQPDPINVCDFYCYCTAVRRQGGERKRFDMHIFATCRQGAGLGQGEGRNRAGEQNRPLLFSPAFTPCTLTPHLLSFLPAPSLVYITIPSL